MTVSIECAKCQADFEFEIPELLKDPSRMVCPNCGAKAKTDIVESLATAADEVITHIRRLHNRFHIALTIEDEDAAEDPGDPEEGVGLCAGDEGGYWESSDEDKEEQEEEE